MSRTHRTILLTAALTVIPLAASAAPVVIGLNEDYLIQSTGFNSNNQNSNSSLRIGEASSDALRNGVLIFQMPSLLPGESFGSASLTAHLESLDTNSGANNFTWNADVFAFNTTTDQPAIITGSEPAAGVEAPTGMVAVASSTSSYAGFSLVVDNFLTPTTTPGSVEASGNLATVLNTLYDNGNNAGDYFYLRISPDTDASSIVSSTGYFLRGSEQSNFAGATFITYTAVPEPASAALLGVAGMFLARRRRTA